MTHIDWGHIIFGGLVGAVHNLFPIVLQPVVLGSMAVAAGIRLAFGEARR